VGLVACLRGSWVSEGLETRFDGGSGCASQCSIFLVEKGCGLRRLPETRNLKMNLLRTITALIASLIVTGCGGGSDDMVGTWSRTSIIRNQDNQAEAGKYDATLSIFGDGTFVSSGRVFINGQSPDQGDMTHGTWEFNDGTLILDFANDEPTTKLIYNPSSKTLMNNPHSSDLGSFSLQSELHEKNLAAISALTGEWEGDDNGHKLTFVFDDHNQLNLIEGNKLLAFSFHAHFCTPFGMLETIGKDELKNPGRDFYLAEFIAPDRLRIGRRNRDRTIKYISWDYVDKALILKKVVKN
jgi:hypothetical protein